MLRRAVAALASSAALATVLVAAPTASAEPNPADCPKGYFCAWEGPDQTGRQVVRTAGNWTGWAWYQSYFNNGYVSPGADHVDLHYNWQGLDGSFCVHYNPGPGNYKGSVSPGVVITGVVWRGEC
ncbi:hypothetical protein GCM10020229_34580 [Kitasatospora albolonga]|uniref:peptidase inhibitor family I36 protein n=1 Tax=Kitasatospora albolonga TaxID=68173 RepID=UPI0031EDEB15